ncbi:hypothetical protein C0995_016273 [Termitomyces sp. Mi166|nr:hypothetical protein C0995_016273 [Termitomyces sp. Mi166\
MDLEFPNRTMTASPLPVRRKEFERNVKCEFGKTLGLSDAHALIGIGVQFTVNNAADKGQKTVQLWTTVALSSRALVIELWRLKVLENIVDLSLMFEVERKKTSLKRILGFSRLTFAQLINLPSDLCNINVSPDQRTNFLSGEKNSITKLKTCIEETLASSRSTYDIGNPHSQRSIRLSTQKWPRSDSDREQAGGSRDGDGDEDGEGEGEGEPGPSKRLKQRASGLHPHLETGNERAVLPPPVGPSPVERSEIHPSSGDRSSATERSDRRPRSFRSYLPRQLRFGPKSSSPPPPRCLSSPHHSPVDACRPDDTAEVVEDDAMNVDNDPASSSDPHDDTPIVLSTSRAA